MLADTDAGDPRAAGLSPARCSVRWGACQLCLRFRNALLFFFSGEARRGAQALPPVLLSTHPMFKRLIATLDGVRRVGVPFCEAAPERGLFLRRLISIFSVRRCRVCLRSNAGVCLNLCESEGKGRAKGSCGPSFSHLQSASAIRCIRALQLRGLVCS